MNFMERVLSGQIENLEEELSNEIDCWHQRPDDGESIGEAIHLFLGMTWQEYAQWAQYPDSLSDIIAKRKLNDKETQ